MSLGVSNVLAASVWTKNVSLHVIAADMVYLVRLIANAPKLEVTLTQRTNGYIDYATILVRTSIQFLHLLKKQKVINPRDIAVIDGDIVVFGSNLSIIANVSTDAMGIVDDAHVEQKDDALMQIGEF